MAKKAAFVEDDEEYLVSIKRMLGDKMISARTFIEFEKELLPQKNSIAVWFLDMEIPMIEGGKPENEYGIKVAGILYKKCFDVPRYCISSNKPDEKLMKLYTGYVRKNDIFEIRKKIKEVL